MTAVPDERFPIPEQAGPGSVWADRTGSRTLRGHNRRGVEIPIGKGEGEISLDAVNVGDRLRVRPAFLQRVQQRTERLVHLTPESSPASSAPIRVTFGNHPHRMDGAR